MLNQIVLQGRLTTDPELKTTANGLKVVTFSIAVQRDYSKDNAVDFIDVVAWRSTAEFISKYFSKGKMIIVSGSLQTRDWEDREGKKRKAYEVIVNAAHFSESTKKEAEPKNDGYIMVEDEDLPF